VNTKDKTRFTGTRTVCITNEQELRIRKKNTDALFANQLNRGDYMLDITDEMIEEVVIEDYEEDDYEVCNEELCSQEFP